MMGGYSGYGSWVIELRAVKPGTVIGECAEGTVLRRIVFQGNI